MQTSPKIDCRSFDRTLDETRERKQQTAGRVYQYMTIAAMLLLLVSLWVF